jgi:hypothetical protein
MKFKEWVVYQILSFGNPTESEVEVEIARIKAKLEEKLFNVTVTRTKNELTEGIENENTNS